MTADQTGGDSPNPPSPRQESLDPETLALLLDEVSAMAATGRPLSNGLIDLESVSKGKLKRAADTVRMRIDRGESASESLAALSPEFNGPIRVAMKIMATNRSTAPLHEAARLVRSARQDRQRLRLASINPIINVVVAAAILCLVIPWILVSLSESELIPDRFSPTVIEICTAFAKNFGLATAAAAVMITLFSLLYFGVMRKAKQGSNALRDHATFCRWMALQLQSDSSQQQLPSRSVETGSLIDNAAEVAGPEFSRSWSGVTEKVRQGATSVTSLALPTAAPGMVKQCVVDLVGGARDRQSIAMDLQRLADLFSQRANQRNERWISLFPQILSWILLIAMLIILLRSVLAPLFKIASEAAL